MRDPALVVQSLQTDRRRLAVVAEAQDRLREIRRRHRVGELRAQRRVLRIGAVGGGDGHGPF